MTNLDQQIRDELSRIVDSAPMAPTQLFIEQHDEGKPKPVQRRPVLAAAAAVLVLFVGGAFWATRDHGTDGIVVAGTAPIIQFGNPLPLDLPTTVNTKLPMAISGDALIVGHSPVSPESYLLELIRVDTPTSTPTVILSEPVGGMLLALEASGNTVVAVVSQHVTSQLPLIFLSADRGDTWSSAALPAPPGVPLSEAAAIDAAISDDTIVVVGPNGVWVSQDGTDWQYVEILTTEVSSPPYSWDQLSEVTWTGTEFVLAGGIIDPTIPDAGDHDVAFWRSSDGIVWTGPEVVLVDPSIRTSDGVDHIVSDGNGRLLSLTATQQWESDGRTDGTDRGTLVVFGNGEGFATEHLSDWILYDAFAVPGGFAAAGVREGEPNQPRMLSTIDGRTWTDIGPAPAVSDVGLLWNDHIVINGPQIEGGNPNLTWVIPIDEPTSTVSSTPTSVPTTNDVATTQPIPTTTTPEAAPDGFGEEWTTKPGPGLGQNLDDSRSAIYRRDDGAVISVATQGGTFGFPDLDKVPVGAVNAWVLPDPESTDISYITASGNGGTTHLRVAGLEQEEAVAAAGMLFTTESTTFAEIDDGGNVIGDRLPLAIGEFEMIGEVATGLSSLRPFETLTIVNNQTGDEATARFYLGADDIAVAQAELLFAGAKVNANGVYTIEVTENRKATIGRTASDGRFIVITSDQIDLNTLAALSEKA